MPRRADSPRTLATVVPVSADGTWPRTSRSPFQVCGQQVSDMAGWAGYGYCASHSRFFSGLRLYLVCTPSGMPITWALANPKIDERQVLAAMLDREPHLATDRPGLLVIADKGFASKEFENDLAMRGAELLRPSFKREKRCKAHRVRGSETAPWSRSASTAPGRRSRSCGRPSRVCTPAVQGPAGPGQRPVRIRAPGCFAGAARPRPAPVQRPWRRASPSGPMARLFVCPGRPCCAWPSRGPSGDRPPPSTTVRRFRRCARGGDQRGRCAARTPRSCG
ncbi:transposase [Streptomyces sp. NPDC088560]|uniref:transposase n=1 Tax=Streptomyces sp. NPDC088560 TaxID=3365868 RepID=UPI00381148C3